MSKIGSKFDEVMSFLDESEEMKELKEIKLMGIYYDNPRKAKDHLRAVCGFELSKNMRSEEILGYLRDEGW